ncbi:MAG: 3-isopropylmalate dehydratase small subunit [Spirochaetes bacterium]|nr:3-isopropylmalate dehydratase small subunit [Spirochaetota bacterium]
METHVIHKLGNDIDTDQIIASQYLMLPDIENMKKFAFETIDPDFTVKFKTGDCIAGGKNFGCGSSREQAPAVIKAIGATAVIAESFARIFFRNAINIGLMLIQCPQIGDDLNDADSLSIDLKNSIIVFNGKTVRFHPFTGQAHEIISEGGLIEFINKQSAEDKK